MLFSGRLFLSLAALCAAPAWAAEAPPAAAQAAPAQPIAANAPPVREATAIPEPDTLVLFLIGASGLLVGQRLSRNPRRTTPREE